MKAAQREIHSYLEFLKVFFPKTWEKQWEEHLAKNKVKPVY